MSVEVLRRAAALMREDYADVRDADEHFVLAVADWLDAAYADWHYSERSLSAMSVRAMSGGDNLPDVMALAVARAYIGESSCGS